MSWVLAFLSLHFGRIIGAEWLSVEWLWLYWEALNLATISVLTIAACRLISYRQLRLKLLLFIASGLALWTNLSYLLSIVARYLNIWAFIYDLLAIVICATILPLLGLVTLRSYAINSATYDSRKTYLAYKHPKNVLGLLCALITLPVGSVCLVSDGRQFAFSKGYVRETKHVYGKWIYEEVVHIPAHTCGLELNGKKWSWTDHCFTLFRRYIEE